MTSPWLEREAAIVRMAVSLKRLSDSDLTHNLRRAGCYAEAGIAPADYGAFDDFALDRERLRRTRIAIVREKIGSAAALVMLCIGFYSVWLATPGGC